MFCPVQSDKSSSYIVAPPPVLWFIELYLKPDAEKWLKSPAEVGAPQCLKKHHRKHNNFKRLNWVLVQFLCQGTPQANNNVSQDINVAN